MHITTPTTSLSAALLAFVSMSQPVLAQTVFPTGTTIYDPAEAYSSYILISDHSAVSNHPSARSGQANGEVRATCASST